MNNDPYDVLGIGKDASPEEIKAAYRARSKAAHPDAGGSVEEFQRIKSASMVLLDPSKRKQFDEEGIIDDGGPDNKVTRATEQVAHFFIHQVNTQNNLDYFDLITAAEHHFRAEIAHCNQRIHEGSVQVARFEKALSKLKIKKGSGVIKTMMTHHMGQIKKVMAANEEQMGIFKMSIAILSDYDFEHIKPQILTNQQALNTNSIFGPGFWGQR